MSANCTRLVTFAGPQPDPLAQDAPQLLLVQGRVGVNIEPIAIKNAPAPLEGAVDFWDLLVDPRFDKEGYVVLYEAELQDNSEIIVKRDLFGPGDFPHTFSGWPIPGDEGKPPQEAPAPPKMTEAQQEALDRVYAKRKGDAAKTVTLRGKVSNWGEDVPAKKNSKK